ncbi:MAG TPA: GAF domain-containing protein [Blastocatellia bacterium]|nr:GAF domain-containing protein [Blastocatellia bacterium]
MSSSNLQLDSEAAHQGQPPVKGEVLHLAFLNELSRVMRGTTDIDIIFSAAMKGLAQTLDFDYAEVLIHDAITDTLTAQSVINRGHYSQPVTQSFRFDDPLIRKSIESAGPVFADEPIHQDIFHGIVTDDEQFSSRAVFPLVSNGGVLGVISVSSRGQQVISDSEIKLFMEVSERLAFALNNSRLLATSERKRRELEGLYEIAQAFSAAREPSESYGMLTRTVAQLLVAERCIIVLKDRDSGRIEPVEPGYGISDERYSRLKTAFANFPHASEIFRTGKIKRWNNAGESSEFFKLAYGQLANQSVLGAPLLQRNEVIGAIYCMNRPGGFTDDDEQLLSIFAHQVAEAVTNNEYYKQAQRQARREQLVNHVNRAINRSLNIDDILQAAVNELGRAASAKSSAFYLLGDDEKTERVYCYAISPDSATVVDWPSVECDDASVLEIHVVCNDRVAGRLVLKRGSEESWADEDIALAQSVADHLSIAIKNSELFQQTDTAARHLALLNHIGNASRKGMSLGDLLKVSVQALGRLLNISLCGITICDSEDGEISDAESYSEASFAAPAVNPFSVDNPFFRLAMSKGQTIKIDDIEDASKNEPMLGDIGPSLLSIDARSLLISPIITNNESVGALCLLQCGSRRRWRAAEVELAQALSTQIASVIEQSRLNEAIDQRAREAIALYQASNALALSLNLDELLDEIMRVMREVLCYQSATLLLFNEDHTELYMRATFGLDTDWVGWGMDINEPSIVTDVARKGEPINITDVRGDSRYITARAASLSELAVPLKIDNEVIGVLEVEADTIAAFRDRDVNLLTAFADKVAIAIRQVRLFEQVSRSKEEWETTFDAMKDAIFIFDRNASIVRANSAAAELIKWDEKRTKAPGSPNYFLDGDELVKGAIEESQTLETELECAPLGRLFHITIYPILDGDGNVEGAVKIAHDLTVLRSAERDARENQDFAAELVDNVYDAIFTTDLHGRFNWLNQQTSAVSGYTESELIGLNFTGLIISEEVEKTRLNFTSAAQGKPQGFETRMVHKNGEIRTLLVTFTPFRRRQRIVGVLGIARDVTEQRRAQINTARSDKLHALGELASGVAHDFNNILAAILGRAQLMKTYTNDERIQRSLEIIAQAALDGGNTIKRIQNFTRRRADRDFLTHDITRLITDAVDITRTRWKDEAELAGRKISVKTELSPYLFCEGDATELREVFINLILNSVDAMPRGGELKIIAKAEDQCCVIKFIDTGVGMTEDVRNRIFDPFFTTKGVEGTGLGLSVSYGIIGRHNGRIEVESTPGAGACFTITLPLAEEGSESESTDEQRHSAAPARILVVDDESTIREVLTEILQTEGHSVVAADGGKKALELMSEQEFDLVFTDLGMPEMNGWEVAKYVKAMSPNTPVIMTTGWGEEIDSAQASREGVDYVVAKPFQVNEIFNLVADVLSKRKT